MSNVLVEKNKIDLLANAISAKSGEPLTLTLDEMVEAVDGIEVGGGITPTGNIDITQVGVTDVTEYATATVSQSYYELFTDYYFETVEGVRKFKVQAELDDRSGGGGFIYLSPYEAKLGATTIFNAIGKGTSITPTESSSTIGMANTPTVLEGVVTINAIPSNYVGSGITQRSSSDLTASGATVSVPSGYYASNASKAVSSGSATPASSISGTSATVSTGTNTLTLTKTISNTPQVSAGYVSSGTAGNTNVSLTASVNTRSSSDLTASTLTVTAPSGYYASNATKTLTDANLTAGNIKKNVTIFGVTGTLESGGGSSKNVQVVQGTTRTTSSTLTAIGAEMTVSKTGTYDVYWSSFRSNTSTQYTYATKLYINGTGYGSEQTTWSNHQQNVHLSNVSLSANDKIRVYGRESRGSSYYMYAPTLVIIEV